MNFFRMASQLKQHTLPNRDLCPLTPVIADGRFLNSFPILVGDAQELWTTPRDKTIVSNDSLHGGASEISQVEKTSFQFPIARNERFYSGRRFDVFKAKRTVLFSCKICFKGFSSKLGYDNHMKQRHGTRDQCFSCNVCEKMFPTSNMLTIHQLYIRTTGLLNVHNVGKDTNTRKTSRHIAVDSHVLSSYKTVKHWIHGDLYQFFPKFCVFCDL